MSDIIDRSGKTACITGSGSLPECAPLANAYVPMQDSSMPQYDTGKALARGTLFPGLDLPFMNMVNTGMSEGPMAELMGIDFVTHELGMYLDTHPDDKDAFDMLQSFLELQMEATRRYTEKYGPIQKTDMVGMSKFSWLNDPWPWEYDAKEVK